MEHVVSRKYVNKKHKVFKKITKLCGAHRSCHGTGIGALMWPWCTDKIHTSM